MYTDDSGKDGFSNGTTEGGHLTWTEVCVFRGWSNLSPNDQYQLFRYGELGGQEGPEFMVDPNKGRNIGNGL